MTTKTTQRTDGPWMVGAKRSDGLVNITNRCGLGIASVMPDDAALVAAAPDLLAAALAAYIEGAHRGMPEEIQARLRAAIAAAEGRAE